MNKKSCELISDLLPLYADNVCSGESRAVVAEHIAECEDCRRQLKKMNCDIKADPTEDIKTIQRIKKRIFIEKLVIIIISVLFVVGVSFGTLFLLLNTDKTMDYEKYGLSENVWVEQDENGDLWLVRKGLASQAWFIYPDIKDSDGNHIDDEAFDKDKISAFGYTLKQRAIDDFAITESMIDNEERTLLFNMDERAKIDTIYYYDDENDAEYVLWERS
ncbi:MAG: zf-HC2 domain-containing protein [Oscillospiraceae bacterium]|nr:zf-HC2 domain-containing protein [Oscillospiraceae bacterium]